MKILIIADIEGASGVDDYNQIAPMLSKKGYEECIINICKDISAAVNGLKSAGAKKIDVFDGHGNGGNIRKSLLPYDVDIIKSDLISLSKMNYDALVLIGQHACAGTSNGFLSHSFGIDYALSINGKPVGEIETISWLFGTNGTPLIFITGDDAAIREAKHFFDEVNCVSVKDSVSRHETICKPIEKTEKLIGDSSKDSLLNISKTEPQILEGDITLEIEFTKPEVAAAMGKIPHFILRDKNIVKFISRDFNEVFEALNTANFISANMLIQSTVMKVFSSKGPKSVLPKIVLGLLMKKMMVGMVKNLAEGEMSFTAVKY